jgi:hypothetical protein
MLGYFTIGILALVVFLTAIFRGHALLYLYAFVLPFFGIIAEVGVQVTPFLIVALGMILHLGLKQAPLVLPKALMPFIIYAIGFSVIMSFFLPSEIYQYPPLRGQWRWVSQIIVFLLLMTPVFFVMNVQPNREQLIKAISWFLMAMVCICLTGFVQIFVFKLTGTDLFPINMFTNEVVKDELRSALARISSNEKVLRMTGFGAGEPKHFGYSCSIAFILNLLCGMYFPLIGFRKLLLRFCLGAIFLAGVLLSLSTQAYFVLGISVFLLTVIVFFKYGVKSRKFIVLVTLCVSGTMVILVNDYSRRLVELRIFERLEETGAVEDFNQTIYTFLKHNPSYMIWGTGMGNVHFWANEYIPKEFRYYMSNSIFVAKAGFLRLVSELGFFGLLLFSTAFIMLGWRIRQNLRLHYAPEGELVLMFLILVIINYFVTSDASPYYIFSIALAFLYLQTTRPLKHGTLR